MWRWMVAGGAVWLTILALFAIGLRRETSRPRLTEPPRGAALVRELNEPQRQNDQWWDWRVTRATSAHRAMVVDVEARRVEDAMAIAIQIVEPVRDDGYEEILIYVREANTGNGPIARRVQWTPRGGFAELVFSD